MSSPVFKCVVLFVNDVATSRHFYEGLLGQQVENDFGANVSYVGGLALWDAKSAVRFVHGPAADAAASPPLGRNNLEAYFESDDVDAIAIRLTEAGVQFVHPVKDHPWGQRALRVYDPDGHIVEIGEPMPAVVRRLAHTGLDRAAISQRTLLPPAAVTAILDQQ